MMGVSEDLDMWWCVLFGRRVRSRCGFGFGFGFGFIGMMTRFTDDWRANFTGARPKVIVRRRSVTINTRTSRMGASSSFILK